ncbi:MAG: hypothetical protein AB1298_02120 [Bacteroidota bacterium]
MDEVSDKIDFLSFETFDSVFPVMVSGVKEVRKLRDELIEEYGLEKLLKYEPDLFYRAKQIERKFDNIIGAFSQEEKKLERELFGFSSKKKIANYLRL